MLQLNQENPKLAYFSSTSRFWEFGSGALIYFVNPKITYLDSPKLRKYSTLLLWVLLSVVILYLPLNEENRWPSILTLIPVLLNLLILAQNMPFSTFKISIIKWTADNSYNLYLWHWPLIVLTAYFSDLEFWSLILVFLFSMFILYLIKNYKQRYNSGKGNFKSIIYYTLLTSFLFAILSIPKIYDMIYAKNTYEAFEQLYHYPREIAPRQFGFLKTHLRYNETVLDFDPLNHTSFSTHKPNYLLIGDCHAGMFSKTLIEIANKKNINLIPITMDETFPTQNSNSKFSGPKELMERIFNEFIPHNAKFIDKIILMADYSVYPKDQLTTFLKQNDQYFKAYEIPITYLGQTQKYHLEYPVVRNINDRFNISENSYQMRETFQVNNFMRTQKHINYINILDNDSAVNVNITKNYRMYDEFHYTESGVSELRTVLNRIFITIKH